MVAKEQARRGNTQHSRHSRVSEGRFSPGHVIEALYQAGGVIAAAARALGCNRSTVYDYMKRHKSVRAAYDDVNEASLDHAESGLSDFMKGEVEGQTTRERLEALKFFLRTKGKGRGKPREPSTRGQTAVPWKSEASTSLAIRRLRNDR